MVNSEVLVAQTVKRLPLQCERPRFDLWVGKIPWRRKWQPTPVQLPRKSHGQRSLVGYSPWGRKESNTTERLHFLSLTFPLPPQSRCCHINSGQQLPNHYMFTCSCPPFYQSESEVPQSCLTLCNPMDYSLSGSSVHGIFQARVLEWVAISLIIFQTAYQFS